MLYKSGGSTLIGSSDSCTWTADNFPSISDCSRSPWAPSAPRSFSSRPPSGSCIVRRPRFQTSWISLRPALSESWVLLEILAVSLVVHEGDLPISVGVFDANVMNDLVHDFSFELFSNSFVSGNGGLGPLRFVVRTLPAGQICGIAILFHLCFVILIIFNLQMHADLKGLLSFGSFETRNDFQHRGLTFVFSDLHAPTLNAWVFKHLVYVAF